MRDFLTCHRAADGTPAAASVPRFAAIGVFDGVHLGHRRIVGCAAERAAETGAIPLALSFTPHPRRILSPGTEPELLMPESVRAAELCAAGAQETAFIRFDAAVAALEPEAFLQALAENDRFRIAGICVGSRWRFGRGGAGGGADLARFCAARGWEFVPVPELEIDGETVSSSAVRAAARTGDIAKVRRLTGGFPTLYGRVVRGFHVAGTELAAPTANLEPSAGVLPPDGVYAGSAEADGRVWPAAVNIGLSPTFDRGVRRVEVHLIGYSGQLYDRELAVELRRFLRNERKFPDPEALQKQIADDVRAVTEIITNGE